ncbi:ABC transporter substrate-binding protein [Microbacterium sulfonylureivorans]|uniref:ABC transporter substrate-binding protein n=1 Tax=Microbacterium sulfonylureivorans TaxID=2486854 RepID=UPI0013DEAB5E|nr:extracellular solute-binding protein [Microbacterium sulfonylureivorans]
MGALVLAIVLPGCASPSDEALSFWSFTGIQQGDQVDRYLDANPDARIELSEIGTSTETADALTAALAAGQTPDLVLIQGDDLPRFVSADRHFLDLRRFAGEDAAEGYLPWAWEAATTQSGRVIGIPTDVGGMALAYRSDLFEQAGLPTDPGEVEALWPTWDAFIEVGTRFAARSDAAFVDNVSTTVFVNASNQLPVKYYDAEGRLVHSDNAGLREAFDTALDAHAAHLSAGVAAFTPGWSGAMARGDFAVMAAPSWMLRVIKSTAPKTSGKWRIASVPGVAGNWGGSYLAIPAGSKHPEAAWDYIAATQSATAQRAHFAAGGPLPAAVAPYEEDDLAAYADPFFGASPIGAVLANSILGMRPVRQGPASSTINTAFVQALAAVEQGSLSPADAWRSALDAAAVALPTASDTR